MPKQDDIFEARLRQLQDHGAAKASHEPATAMPKAAPQPKLEPKRKRKAERSSPLLALAALVLLLVGGGAFGMMLFLPDPVSGERMAAQIEWLAPVLNQ